MNHRFVLFVILLCSMAFCSLEEPPVHVQNEERGHNGCQFYYDSVLQEKVHITVQSDPEFIGGAASWQRFLNKNFRFPLDMNENGENQYGVYTICVIDKEGKLLDIRIDQKPDSSTYSPLDREFIRLVKQVPRWKPAVCNGQKVTCVTQRIITGCVYYEYEN
ncbi:energy transducer TonB [Paraflavitalea pollutisoli]|uniref:energy transducer TonB n=1 Tax=Paraflavitalea pollutisoli TaxID=3034143 RepID=UPI0023EAC0F4|nr:energy transducer TonB [Paraflavitalea sp. H1-2-19X]